VRRFRHHLHGGRIEADLPGQINGVADAHGLRIGADGGRGVRVAMMVLAMGNFLSNNQTAILDEPTHRIPGKNARRPARRRPAPLSLGNEYLKAESRPSRRSLSGRRRPRPELFRGLEGAGQGTLASGDDRARAGRLRKRIAVAEARGDIQAARRWAYLPAPAQGAEA
jgi:hypothetical protein